MVRRLNNPDPHVVLQAITVLDACVNNCGRSFLLEVASREFETEFKKLLTKSHPKVVEKLKAMLKTWADGEFSKDAAYSLIPALYASLRKEGMDFSSEEDRVKKTKVPSDPMMVASQQEEDDIAKAIQLSLQESKGSGSKAGTSSSSSVGNVLYPTESLYSGAAAAVSAASGGAGPSVKKEDEKKGRALYDFEAAEDNELTFKAGELVIILDDADPNWWKGSNHRGEGLFPSNFVTMDLSGSGERKRSVAFNEEVEVKEVEQVTWPVQNTIDEEKINSLLGMLHDADPTTGDSDPPDLARLEEQVGSMGPLIDTELETVDRRHAQLTRLSHQLVDALTLYHTLMRDTPPAPAPGAYGMYGAPPGPAQHPGMYMPGQPPAMGHPGMMPPMSSGHPGPMPGPPMPMYSAAGPGPMPGVTMPPMGPGMAMTQPPQPGQEPAPPSQTQGGQQQMYMDPYMYQAQGPAYSMMPGSAPPPTPPLQDQPLSVHPNGQQQQQI